MVETYEEGLVEQYNDDLIVSGENIFKKIANKIKSAVKGKSISVSSTGLNVVNQQPEQITVAPIAETKGVSDYVKNPLVIGAGLLAVVLLMKGKNQNGLSRKRR